MSIETLNETLTSIWTVWAVAVFFGILIWALRPSNRHRFERDARIPLDDEA